MIPKQAKQAVGQRLLSRFRDAGATEIAPDILLPAGDLLDLYGEDIRARAYVTSDPMRGEQMLRPDFTVPVVQSHMAGGAEPARYTYAGEVFRRQEHDPDRSSECRRNARPASLPSSDNTDPRGRSPKGRICQRREWRPR